MLRFEVSEVGQEALPAVDIGDDAVVIGSGAAARIRLPAHAAREAHVRVAGARWTALADVRVIDPDAPPSAAAAGAASIVDATVIGHRSGGRAFVPPATGASPAGPDVPTLGPGVLHRAGDTGVLGGGVVFQLGEYRVRVAPAPREATAASPQRTESLARELVRGLLGAGAAPMLEIEKGPVPGIQRTLPPPEVTVVIGRGEESGWIILDEDLSRAHAEVHRGWDGVSIMDRGSKNGTKVDGVRIEARTPLRDGARIELGNVVLRFRDPAERHLRGEATAAGTPGAVHRITVERAPDRPPAASSWPFVIATAIAGLAIAGLVWILAT